MKEYANKNFNAERLLTLGDLDIRGIAAGNDTLTADGYFSKVEQFIEKAPQYTEALGRASDPKELEDIKKALAEIGYNKLTSDIDGIYDAIAAGKQALAEKWAAEVSNCLNTLCDRIKSAYMKKKFRAAQTADDMENPNEVLLAEALEYFDYEEAHRKLRILAVDDIATMLNTLTSVCAAILLCAFVAALYYSYRIKPESQSEIPPGRVHDAGVFGDDIVVHDSAGGEIVIGADSAGNGTETVPLAATPLKTVSDPEAIWNGDTYAYAGIHTLVEMAQMKNGSIGILTIPKLNLSVNVYESQDNNMEAMSKGVAHFPSTSAYDGNVGLSAHNVNFDGSDGYFKYLFTLQKGDGITYQTALGERTYTVTSITSIAASDWTPLYYTDDNRLTLITCISGQADKRLCVTAVEQAAV